MRTFRHLQARGWNVSAGIGDELAGAVAGRSRQWFKERLFAVSTTNHPLANRHTAPGRAPGAKFGHGSQWYTHNQLLIALIIHRSAIFPDMSRRNC